MHAVMARVEGLKVFESGVGLAAGRWMSRCMEGHCSETAQVIFIPQGQ